MPRRARRVALTVVAVLALAIVGLLLLARVVLAPAVYDVDSIADAEPYQDPELLARAWALPVASSYGPQALQSQPRASYCGPASVANVVTSLGLDPDATPASVLDGTGYCWIGQCIPGLTLDELAEIAGHNLGSNAEVVVLRDLSLEEFRAHMRAANDPQRRYIVNFLRGPLFREGGGHHSPIGGYLEPEDLVLVLDVNANFGPWLVPTARLHAAVDTIDPATDQRRGLLLIGR